MISKIEISIIIPFYNSYDLLVRLLNSIPIDKRIEVIIVDDKSNIEEKEKTKNLIKKSKHNIKYRENKGIKSAGTCRNIGIKLARGKWILFADSDDFFVENFLKIVDKYIDTDYNIVFFKPISCYSDTLLPAERHIYFCELIDSYFTNKTNLEKLKYGFVVPWSKLISREFILKNTIFFDEIIASNDVMFSVKTAYFSKNNVEVSNENIYCVTVNQGSLTLRKNKEIFEARFLVHQRKNKFCEKVGKKEFCSMGLSYIIRSKEYGLKYFCFILKECLKDIRYIFNNFKNWKKSLYNIFIVPLKNKKYYTK